jgi:hypothetical protein
MDLFETRTDELEPGVEDALSFFVHQALNEHVEDGDGELLELAERVREHVMEVCPLGFYDAGDFAARLIGIWLRTMLAQASSPE